jgi:predicted dehydrogenase
MRLALRRAAAIGSELVNDSAVDAVVIASPQAFHREIAEAAFALGKPVFAKSRWALRSRMPRHGRGG